MQLIRETNLYDDEAIGRAVEELNDTIESVNAKVQNTYGTCATSASVAAKVVSLRDFVLFTGARITVTFNYANTAANPTLNVNNTGAKPIWARNAAIEEKYYWTSQSRVDFVYDGTHWSIPNAKSHEETFNELTNNGVIRGIYMQNNQMYVNMDYLQSGTVTLGGANNGNGLLQVKNSSGTVVGKWDMNGINIISGTLCGWSISSTLLNKETTVTSGTASTQYGVYLQTPASPTASSVAICARQRSYSGSSYGSWSNNFYVRYDGYVYAKNLHVEGGAISGASLTLGGASNGNGTLVVKNASNSNVITLNNSGLTMTSGTINLGSGAFSVDNDGYARMGTARITGGMGCIASNGRFVAIMQDSATIVGGYNADPSWKTPTGGGTFGAMIGLDAATSASPFASVQNHTVEINAYSGHLCLSCGSSKKALIMNGYDGMWEPIVTSYSSQSSMNDAIKYIYSTSTSGTYYIGFTPYSGTTRFATLTTSDEKLKKNIVDTGDIGLSTINRIEHKSFDYKEGGWHRDCGYIAQQLQNISKCFVIAAPDMDEYGNQTGETLQIVDHEILVFATKAIQELSDIVERQQLEINSMRNI